MDEYQTSGLGQFGCWGISLGSLPLGMGGFRNGYVGQEVRRNRVALTFGGHCAHGRAIRRLVRSCRLRLASLVGGEASSLLALHLRWQQLAPFAS